MCDGASDYSDKSVISPSSEATSDVGKNMLIRTYKLYYSIAVCSRFRQLRGSSGDPPSWPGRQAVRHAHQVRHRAGAHLAHDLAAVDFYRDLADAKLPGDLFVE